LEQTITYLALSFNGLDRNQMVCLANGLNSSKVMSAFSSSSLHCSSESFRHLPQSISMEIRLNLSVPNVLLMY